jgi:hypothetical protein
MEPSSQQLISCPYPDPGQSSPSPPKRLLEGKYSYYFFLPTHRSFKWSVFLRFPHYTLLCTSSLPIRATCPPHTNLLDLITRKLYDERKSSSPLLFSMLGSSITSFLSEPKIFLSTLSTHTRTHTHTQSVCSSLTLKHQILCQYKTKQQPKL